MCMYCKCDEMREARTSYAVTLEECTVVVRNVPCMECAQCGERFFAQDVMEQLDEIVERAGGMLQEVSIVDFSKAA